MGTILTKAGYEQLIDGDIAWAQSQPRTLERDHVIDVLKYLRANRSSLEPAPSAATVEGPKLTNGDFVKLLQDATTEVFNSVLWSKFIDGTPLANDIPVWMARFAAQKTVTLERDLAATRQRCERLKNFIKWVWQECENWDGKRIRDAAWHLLNQQEVFK